MMSIFITHEAINLNAQCQQPLTAVGRLAFIGFNDNVELNVLGCRAVLSALTLRVEPKYESQLCCWPQLATVF